MDKPGLVTLYQQGAYGLKEWKIYPGNYGVHIIANGCEYYEGISEGKAGRSLDQQIALRMEARIRSKLDSGFKRTREEALATAAVKTNQLQMPMPMLARKFADVRATTNTVGCFYQPKLDGHRCIITRQGSNIFAYSRRGKEVTTLSHITDKLEIPDDLYLDGEIYKHGMKLQNIASLAKRQQEGTDSLWFCLYDVFMPGEDMTFKERHDVIRHLNFHPGCNIQKVETGQIQEDDFMMDFFREYRSRGFEGMMLRTPHGKYECGERSRHLLKVKERDDGEFKVLDIISSREGWGILLLEIPGALKPCKTLVPGTVPDKIDALKNKEKFIGRMVTCEYLGWTDEGLPFHCIATGWREDL